MCGLLQLHRVTYFVDLTWYENFKLGVSFYLCSMCPSNITKPGDSLSKQRDGDVLLMEYVTMND